MALSLETARSALEKLTCYVKTILPIANAHMVHVFTQKHFKTLLPLQLERELSSFTPNQLQTVSKDLFNPNSDLGNELGRFVSSTRAHTLTGLNVISEIQTVYQTYGISSPITSEFQFDVFMSPKKAHEVSVYCDVIANLANATQSRVVLDVGCGKGHLGTILSLSHSCSVLGLEAQGSIGHVSEKRETLEKMYNSLRAKEISENKHKKVAFQRVTRYVTEDLDLDPIINENYPKLSGSSAILVGLHTCGNLAPTCLKLFLANPHLVAFSNVACCYHLIDEEFCADPYGKTDFKSFGFPLSQQLRDQRFALGRNARMMCVQPIERFAAEEKVHVEVIFYRALLQVVLVDKFGVEEMEVQVGRMKKPCANFIEYAQKALKRLKLDSKVTEEELIHYETMYSPRRMELQCFFQLRTLLAPVIEGLILLDRLVFLLENDASAFLVRLFDPVKSPRCCALISAKRLQFDSV